MLDACLSDPARRVPSLSSLPAQRRLGAFAASRAQEKDGRDPGALPPRTALGSSEGRPRGPRGLPLTGRRPAAQPGPAQPQRRHLARGSAQGHRLEAEARHKRRDFLPGQAALFPIMAAELGQEAEVAELQRLVAAEEQRARLTAQVCLGGMAGRDPPHPPSRPAEGEGGAGGQNGGGGAREPGGQEEEGRMGEGGRTNGGGQGDLRGRSGAGREFGGPGGTDWAGGLGRLGGEVGVVVVVMVGTPKHPSLAWLPLPGPHLHGGLLGEVCGQARLQARLPDRDLLGQLCQPLHRHHLVCHQPLCAAHAERRPLTQAPAGSGGAPFPGQPEEESASCQSVLSSPTGKEGDFVEETLDKACQLQNQEHLQQVDLV